MRFLEGCRYGYQCSEKDNEVKGDGNSYTTQFRQLDPRLGRWLTIDPKASSFPRQSPYCSMDNNPISLNDQLGLESKDWIKKPNSKSIEWDGGVNSSGEAIAKHGTGTEYYTPGSANGGDWSKVDVLSSATAFGSGFLPGGTALQIVKSSALAGAVDASFDYSVQGGFRTIIGPNRKNGRVLLNDFLTGGIGSAGGLSFGKNPLLFEVIGTGVTTFPTFLINSTINKSIDR